MENFVSLKNVSKIYQMGEVEIRAVDGIDFDIVVSFTVFQLDEKLNAWIFPHGSVILNFRGTEFIFMNIEF